jgi:hypothetical protein
MTACDCIFCDGSRAYQRERLKRQPWSEREAVVAYLLDRGHTVFTPNIARAIARGDHLTAAREGRLDHLRERVRGMVK